MGKFFRKPALNRLGSAGLSMAILGICLIILIGLTGCPLFPKEEVEDVSALVQPPSEDLVTHTITEGPINEEISGTARVGSDQEKTLYFLIPGQVREVRLENGDTAKKGQVLVELETGDLDYSVKLAALNLEQEQLRHQSLPYDTNAITRRISAIGWERARLEYERLLERLDHSVIRVPFDCKILDIKVARGKSIEAFATVGTVAGMKGLELIAEVEFNKMLRLKSGMPVRVEIEEGRIETGRIILIKKPEVTLSNSDNYYVHIRMDNPRLLLKMDNYHNVYFVIRSVKRALLVPNDAIREDVNGRIYLRVIDGKQRRDVYIKTGITTETMTQITEGAALGTVVIGK
jgi:multidrug efflux pump subunit AcrA (membrane-fusion protein)